MIFVVKHFNLRCLCGLILCVDTIWNCTKQPRKLRTHSCSFAFLTQHRNRATFTLKSTFLVKTSHKGTVILYIQGSFDENSDFWLQRERVKVITFLPLKHINGISVESISLTPPIWIIFLRSIWSLLWYMYAKQGQQIISVIQNLQWHQWMLR